MATIWVGTALHMRNHTPIPSQYLGRHGAGVGVEQAPEARQAMRPDAEHARKEHVAQLSRAVERVVPEHGQKQRVLFVHAFASLERRPKPLETFRP